MSDKSTETIVQSGYPLGFKVRPGEGRSPVIVGAGTDVFKVEARTLGGHQKEAIVTEGETGSVWRLASDEGTVMNGDDLAPFPLGFFNTGVMGDIYNRVRALAAQRGIKLDKVRIGMAHTFGSNGSFIHSTAKAFSEAVDLKIELDGEIAADAAKELVQTAFKASPAIALLRYPMTENTFALYINGRRRKVVAYQNSIAQDAKDPFLVYASPPRPFDGDGRTDLLEKTGVVESGDAASIPFVSKDKRFFVVAADGKARDADGEFEADARIARPGMSHFKMISDESAADVGPSGLGLMSAGIGLCYLTQLMRYIEAQKLDIHSARLVQFTPFSVGSEGRPGAIDTHLFLNGEAPDETHLNLLTIAARTCFMHVAAAGVTEPKLALRVNGQDVG